MAITKEMVIEAAEALLTEEINPSMAAVRSKLGTGSFSTISPILRGWREGRESSKVTKVEMPSDITAALDKFGAQLWTVATGIATDQLDKIREEARHAVELVNSERNEAMDEITRLESEIIGLSIIQTDQQQIIDDLGSRLNKSESTNAAITQRSEYLNKNLQSAQTEIKEMKNMVESYVDKVEALLIEKANMSGVNSALNEKLVSCEKELQGVAIKRDEMCDRAGNFESVIKQLKVELNQVNAELDQVNKNISDQCNARAQEKLHREVAEQKIAELKTDLERSREGAQQLQNELIALSKPYK